MKKITAVLLCILVICSLFASVSADDSVASVNGTPITAESFKEMAAFMRFQYINNYYQYLQMYMMYGVPYDEMNEYYTQMMGEEGAELIADTVLDQLAYNEILNQKAEAEGLSFTDEEIYDRMIELFGYEAPTEDDNLVLGMEGNVVDPFAMEEKDPYADFKEYLENYTTTYYEGMVSPTFFKEYTRYVLIEDKLFDKELEGKVFEEEMVSARHILVETAEEAQEIIDQLNDGADWAELAAEHSLDSSNKDNSGDLGWFGRGVMVEPFETAAFALEPGTISAEPVQTDFGYHIIASDGKEMRPMEGTALETAQNEVYSEWYDSLLAEFEVVKEGNWADYYTLYPEFVAYEEPAVEEEPVEEAAPVEEAPAEEAALN